MKAYSRKLCLLFTDILLINLAVYAALVFRFDGAISEFYLDRFIDSIITITILKVVIFALFGLYNSLWVYASIEEMLQIFFAVTTTTVARYLIDTIFDIKLPRSVYIISFMVILVL